MTELRLKICPVCNSDRIRSVKRDVESRRGGVAFTAHAVEVEECPVCGERLYSPESLNQIDAQRPRATRSAKRRKSS